MIPVVFVLAAGAGAMTRHRVNLLGWRWRGTLAVNLVGSFLLGWLVAARQSDSVTTVVGVGYLGSLTTFSMFALEATEGTPRQRITVITATLVGCLVAALLGDAVG